MGFVARSRAVACVLAPEHLCDSRAGTTCALTLALTPTLTLTLTLTLNLIRYILLDLSRAATPRAVAVSLVVGVVVNAGGRLFLLALSLNQR